MVMIPILINLFGSMDGAKRKYVILPLVLVCYLLAGCSVSSNENSYTSAKTEIVTDQDDPKEDISKIEQIFTDEYNAQNDDIKCVRKIIEKLGDNGFIAIDSDNKVDMTNADYLMQFISSRESGEFHII